MGDKHKFVYDGPVKEFEKVTTSHWQSETIASTESKARSNFKYQYKKQYGKAVNTRVDLPGKIERVD